MFREKEHWSIFFYIFLVLYFINTILVFVTGNCILVKNGSIYNYISMILNAIFLIIYFNFLKRGSLTERYLVIMFVLLVVLPFIIFVMLGDIAL